jgi:hypothetical protein
MEELKNKNCECTNCKCKTLSKAKDMLEQKRKAVSGGEVVEKQFIDLIDKSDILGVSVERSYKSHAYIEIVQFLKP